MKGTLTGRRLRFRFKCWLFSWLWRQLQSVGQIYQQSWQPKTGARCVGCLATIRQGALYCPSCERILQVHPPRSPYATERMPAVEKTEPMTEQFDQALFDQARRRFPVSRPLDPLRVREQIFDQAWWQRRWVGQRYYEQQLAARQRGGQPGGGQPL